MKFCFRMFEDFKTKWWTIINLHMGYGTKATKSKLIEEKSKKNNL